MPEQAARLGMGSHYLGRSMEHVCLSRLAMPVSSLHQPPNREMRAENTLTELEAPGILSEGVTVSMNE